MSELSFKSSVETITHTSNVGYYNIHLEKAVERLEVIKKLEHDLKTPITTFPAVNGYEIVKNGHPNTCQERGLPATRGSGEIGCTVSHITICREALAKGYEYAVVFEDDCEFSSNLESFHNSMKQFNSLNLPYDLFILGYAPLSTSKIDGTIFSKINLFNATHAYIMNRNFMKKAVETYEEYYSNNTTFAIDGMYSNVIENHHMNAYGPTEYLAYFNYKKMYSYVLEGVR